jgi:glycosyltransferase involved in cell wall biosynthesis
MFKVLVIAYYFPPMGLSGVQRTLKFVKYMNESNWEPTVVTSSNVAYFAHDESLLKELDGTKTRIIRVGGKEPNSLLSKFGTMKIPNEFVRKTFNRISQSIFIPDNKTSWSKRAFQVCSKLLLEEKYDIAFVTIPPFSSFNMAVKLKERFNLPILVDYRDLWLDSYFSFYLTPFHRLLNKRMEYKALKKADKISVTNRVIKEKLLKHYKFLTFNDIVIVAHGYDKEDFIGLDNLKKKDDTMIITYSGVFIEYNTPKYFLRAFKKFVDECPEDAVKIKLRFVGLLRKENERLIESLRIKDYVENLNYLEHKEAVKKLMESDVLWMMIGNKKNIDAILPGKLFEYFGTKKPVIVSVPKGAAKTAAIAYGASFITEPDNIDEIKNTIAKVYKLYKENNLPKPNEDYVESHSRKNLTKLLTQQFQFLIKEDVK